MGLDREADLCPESIPERPPLKVAPGWSTSHHRLASLLSVVVSVVTVPKSDDPPDPETLRRALRTLETLLADPSQMARVYAELDRIDAEAARQRQALLDREGIPVGLLEKLSLTSVSVVSKHIDTMPATTQDQILPPRGPKFAERHPLITRAKALGKSMPAIAGDLTKALKRPVARTTVRSWYTQDPGSARPIPEDAVKFFESEPWRISRSAWRNGTS